MMYVINLSSNSQFFPEKFYSPSLSNWVTAYESRIPDFSASDIQFGDGDHLISIGANPSTFLRPKTGKVDYESIDDLIEYHGQLEPLWKVLHNVQEERFVNQQTYFVKGKKPQQSYGGGLEPTRENIVNSSLKQNLGIGELLQVNLFGYRTKNLQTLIKLVNQTSQADLNQMTAKVIDFLSQELPLAKYIFIGWSASLGNQLLLKDQFYTYRCQLYQLFDQHFDQILCYKLSKSLQPYHASSAHYRLRHLNELISRRDLSRMLKV